MTTLRSRRLLASFTGLLVAALLVAACNGGGSDDSSAPTTPPPDTATTAPVATTPPGDVPTTAPDAGDATTPPAPPTATVEPEPTAVPLSVVNVYWAWTIDTVPGGTPERLGSGSRPVAGSGTLQAALQALLQGPDDIEREIGMSSAIPAGTELRSVNIADGVATVDLSARFEESGGTLGETVRIAQVVFTATQFDSVGTVRFRIDGVDRDALGSHGLDVSGGVDRDDFADVRPAIMVDSPSPGATVPASFHLRGEANTFEANLQWSVTDADGLIVAQGFTTATAGSGTWGTFDTVVDLPAGLTGRGSLIVFESSAKDGSPTNVVEYPINF